MAVRINKGSPMQQLPVVPLVDTVLNLLIFFLVATRFAQAERELDVKLPDASEARPLTAKPQQMAVNIDAEGHYLVAGRMINSAELYPVLNRAWVNNPGRVSVVIRADRLCRWQSVVAAMNACHKAKIRDYRVTTSDAPQPAG
jgi:biopolymer transport protein ExbD